MLKHNLQRTFRFDSEQTANVFLPVFSLTTVFVDGRL
jgi:hypothetical protein